MEWVTDEPDCISVHLFVPVGADGKIARGYCASPTKGARPIEGRHVSHCATSTNPPKRRAR